MRKKKEKEAKPVGDDSGSKTHEGVKNPEKEDSVRRTSLFLRQKQMMILMHAQYGWRIQISIN